MSMPVQNKANAGAATARGLSSTKLSIRSRAPRLLDPAFSLSSSLMMQLISYSLGLNLSGVAAPALVIQLVTQTGRITYLVVTAPLVPRLLAGLFAPGYLT